MDFDQFHFSHPLWLWGMISIPLLWVAFFLFFRPHRAFRQLDKFIDSHLLPHLLIKKQNGKQAWWKALSLWSVTWCLLMLALAGPRWDFREIEMVSKDQSLVILLDLSESMNGTDVKPSRLVRAKQKIEDLINLSKGVKIGLIAFAADPHMIAPITDDKETIRHLLPSLDTDLVYVQGSRLSSALEMASVMLEAEPGSNKALLIIGDGDFEDGSAIASVKKIADKGIVVNTMGIGTAQGAVLQDHQGNIIKKNGVPVISKLAKNTLEDISKIGYGTYLEGHYSDRGEVLVLEELEKRAEAMESGKKNRLWEERFYVMIFPVLPIILWWFRRGAILMIAAALLFPSFLQGSVMKNSYFMNSEEIGKQAFDEGEYETAVTAFQDPYRKGVAYYRAGDFAEAEKMFRQSSREDVACEASYNLGNALIQQQRFKDAITVYEELLKKWPDHKKAKENLALVKQMMEQQKEEEQQSGKSDQENNQQENKPKEKDSDSVSGNQNSTNSDSREDGQGDSRVQQGNSDQQEGQGEKDSEDKPEKGGEEKATTEVEGQQLEKEQAQGDEEFDSQNGQQGEEDKQIEEETAVSEGHQEEKKNEGNGDMSSKIQEDQDADIWLNRISNDPKTFLKNKFYIESKKNGTTEGIDPW